nr:ABC transporter permease subunit [Salidesulfovibrio onnuriiensis]
MPRLFYAFIAFVSLFPLVVMVGYALAPGWTFPDLIPQPVDGRALEYLLSQAGPVARHMGASVLYSLLTVLLTLLFCLSPAHHFARCEFRGKVLLEGLLLAPALVPAMTFSMGVHTMFIHLGLADSFVGVVLVLSTFSYPYMLRALIAGFQAVGPEYEQCARNLGAGFMTRLVRIELPLLVPSMVAGGSVVFLVAFSEYFLVFLIGGGAVDSFTGYLFPYLASSDRSMGALLTLLFLIVPVGLFVFIELAVSRVYRRRGLY